MLETLVKALSITSKKPQYCRRYLTSTGGNKGHTVMGDFGATLYFHHSLKKSKLKLVDIPEAQARPYIRREVKFWVLPL